ncbi:MAG: PDZ domain-containing protein [Stenotrophobium sp.]
MKSAVKWKILWTLLPALAMAAAVPAFAGSDPDAQKELDQARKEMQAAREEMERAVKQMVEASRKLHLDSPGSHAYEFMASPRRAMLGVIIDNAHKRNGEYPGVVIEGVTPGGGAEKAGLKSGDILLSANGETLAAKSGEKPGPEHRLMAVMGKLAPGDPVKLDYERAGQRASVTVTAQRPADMDWSAMSAVMPGDDDEDDDVLIPRPPSPPHPPMASSWTGYAGLHLTRLDSDLADYFKTKQGVLVLKAPEDASLGLKSGDVIQKIDGDSVSDPREVLDAVHDHEPGDKLKLQLMRQGKPLSLDITLPEREPHGGKP